jgi:hypothetical protein
MSTPVSPALKTAITPIKTTFSAFQPSGTAVNQPLLPNAGLASGRTLPTQLGHATSALGLLGVALLLHRLPARPSSFSLLSSDWKDWARLGLGVKAVDETNKAGGWTPPPWLLALQTVTVLAPLTHGVLNPKAYKQLPLLALTVPALVEGTHRLSEVATQQLEAHPEVPVPHWLPNTLIPLASTIVGIVTLRNIVKMPTYQQFLGDAEAGHGAGTTIVGTEAVICGRCGGSHLICMSEIGDMLGSFGAWLTGKPQQKAQQTPDPLPMTQPHFGATKAKGGLQRLGQLVLSPIVNTSVWLKELATGFYKDVKLLLKTTA